MSKDVAPVDASEAVVMLTTAGVVFLLYTAILFTKLTGVVFLGGWGWFPPILGVAGVVCLGAAAAVKASTAG
jgi:hypothetical protein